MAKNKRPNPKDFISIPEYAKQLGISRIAVYKRVKKGQIPAKKVGRNYVIPLQPTEAAKNELKKKHISLPQLAKELGLSQVAVYKRVLKGQILAQKAGRNFVIDAKDYKVEVPPLAKKSLVKVKKFMSIPQLAREMGISRIAVYKKVKSGQIKAEKIGRNYTVDTQEIFTVMSKSDIKPEILSKTHCSIPQLAKQMGVSRWVLYKKVKKGEIKAVKVGRAYVIPTAHINNNFLNSLTDD